MSRDLEIKVKALMDELTALRAEKHLVNDQLTPKEEYSYTVKAKNLMKEITSAITEGSLDCKCGARPHGMIQATSVKKGKPMSFYTIGCLACNSTSVQGFSIENAVAEWNESVLKNTETV